MFEIFYEVRVILYLMYDRTLLMIFSMEFDFILSLQVLTSILTKCGLLREILLLFILLSTIQVVYQLVVIDVPLVPLLKIFLLYLTKQKVLHIWLFHVQLKDQNLCGKLLIHLQLWFFKDQSRLEPTLPHHYLKFD